MTDQTPPPAAAAAPGLEAATLAYLHHLGRALVAADLWVGLPQGDGDGLPMALLPRAIARFGLQLRHLKGQRVAQIVPPCLLVQKGGGVVFVHSVDAKGDQFAVQDPAKDTAPQPISRMDLAALSAGEVVYFIPETEALTEKHAGTTARRHWFWGHFGVIKARIFDVVLASAFANILAVTVSLFALQVYDRVVPNQNEATLWVLASGAAAAIVMEFFLRTNPYIRSIEPINELEAAKSSLTKDRIICYDRSPEKVQLHIPRTLEFLPPVRNNLEFSVAAHARIGGVALYYPKSVLYVEKA